MRDHIDPPTKRTLVDVGLYLTPIGIALYQGAYLRTHPIQVFLLIVAFTAIAKYLLTYRPLIAFTDDAISTFIDHHLELVQGEFEAWHPESPTVDVRVNVMKTGRKADLSFGGPDGIGVEFTQELSITAWAGDYSRLERDLTWKPGEGAVGHAFADGEIHAGTRRADETDWGTAWEMAPQQKAATRDVNSVLAVPVYKPSDHDQRAPVAVLCIDSDSPGDRTAFQTDAVQAKVEEYAAELAVVL